MTEGFIKHISFEEAKKIIDTEHGLLIDVREEEEYCAGHAKEAFLLPLDTIDEASTAEITTDKEIPLILYCRTGSRSRQAAIKLHALGYHAIYDVGGLNGWPYGIDYGL